MYAGFWRRYWALVIDYVIVGLWLFTLLFMFNYLSTTLEPNVDSETFKIRLGIGAIAVYCISNWLYYAGFESSKWQGTPGKYLLGIIVADERDHERISFGRATARYFSRALSAPANIGYIIAAFTENKQTLHDIICRTVTLNKNAVQSSIGRSKFANL